MKPFNSAKTFFEKTSNGGLKATIHHSPMKGVSVKHLDGGLNTLMKIQLTTV